MAGRIARGAPASLHRTILPHLVAWGITRCAWAYAIAFDRDRIIGGILWTHAAPAACVDLMRIVLCATSLIHG